MNKPILDPRTKKDLMDLIQRRAGEYVPEWRYEQGDETDPGAAIATLFGEMFYQTIDRFNLLPQKHYTEFLNLLGVPGPGVTPACGLVRFEASGDGGPVPVPAGTEIFAAAQEEDGTDTVFSTTHRIEAITASLAEAYYVDPEAGRIERLDLSKEQPFFAPTGEENLQILAELKNVPERNIDRVLEIVELTDSRRRKVQQYSLGMRQRLGIAQALLGNPKLLILDEPTNGLDPSGIQQMRNLIKDMPNRCGATVLISSHLLGEMEQMVDQVGIINHGRLLFQGELDDLRKHSQGDISLRVLHPEKAAPILGNSARLERGVFHLPAMDEARLAELIGRLAAAQAGVVELNRATKTLEEIFLSLTGVDVK